MNDFVRLREEASYHDLGMSLEGGYGMAELMADDEDNYQVAGAGGLTCHAGLLFKCTAVYARSADAWARQCAG